MTQHSYGTCLGCGELRASLKSGEPWPHDVMRRTRDGRWLKRICPGCDRQMTDIKPPLDDGRSWPMTSATPVAYRRVLP